VFLDKWDYVKFIEQLREFNRINPVYSLYYRKKGKLRGPTASGAVGPHDKLLVEILAYCLLSNHFHLLLKQKSNRGISEFMRKLGGYTGYFNNKYKRSGSLFQGKFKSTEIRSMNKLLKMSIYVNCNAEIHGIMKAQNWIWSSYLDYIGKRNGTLCNKKIVLDEVESINEYIELCEDMVPVFREVKDLEE